MIPLKRYQIIWFTMYAALFGMILFAIIGSFKGSLLCCLYMEVILISNLILEFKEKEKE